MTPVRRTGTRNRERQGSHGVRSDGHKTEPWFPGGPGCREIFQDIVLETQTKVSSEDYLALRNFGLSGDWLAE